MLGRDMAGLLSMTSIAVIAILASFILPSLRGTGLIAWFTIAILAAVVGIILMLYARIPLYRQGKFLSIGPKELPADRLPAYKWAWRFIGGAIILQLIILSIGR